MNSLLEFIGILLVVYLLCVFLWALLSWLPMLSPQLAYNEVIISVRRFLDSIVEPYVAIFRRIIPPIGNIDVSGMVAMFALIILMEVVGSLRV